MMLRRAAALPGIGPGAARVWLGPPARETVKVAPWSGADSDSDMAGSLASTQFRVPGPPKSTKVAGWRFHFTVSNDCYS